MAKARIFSQAGRPGRRRRHSRCPHRHDGAADSAVPESAGDEEDHRENDEDHVVVGALAREGEREQLPGDEGQVGSVGGSRR